MQEATERTWYHQKFKKGHDLKDMILEEKKSL